MKNSLAKLRKNQGKIPARLCFSVRPPIVVSYFCRIYASLLFSLCRICVLICLDKPNEIEFFTSHVLEIKVHKCSLKAVEGSLIELVHDNSAHALGTFRRKAYFCLCASASSAARKT